MNHKVPLTPNWSDLFTPDEFYKWAEDNKITEKDWNFTTAANSFSNPIMWFERAEDALAFKIRFGL